MSAGRRVTSAVVTVLVLLLPALVGGVGIDAPAGDMELRRLEAALGVGGDAAGRSWPADLYYTAAVPGRPEAGASAGLLHQARLASVGGLVVVSGMVYLLLAMARRRSTGLLACMALAALPPVWQMGAELRPSVPAAAFAGMAMLLLAGFPQQVRHRPGERRLTRWAGLLAAMAAIGCLVGLAAACASSATVLMLVPGGAMLLVVGALWMAIPRLLRRVALPRIPLSAMHWRMAPWVALCAVNLVVVSWTLDACLVGGAAPAGTPSGLLPDRPEAWIPLVCLAAVGGGRLLVGVGIRLDHLRRISPDTVIVIYAAVMLGQRAVGDAAGGALVAAPALAILVAEGARATLMFAASRLLRQPQTNIA